jgi:hypothetical protein
MGESRFIRMPLTRGRMVAAMPKSTAAEAGLRIDFIPQVRPLLIVCLPFCGPY